MQRRRAQISKANATAALTRLLYGCTPERLAGFTAQYLAASYAVPLDKAEQMLSAARQGRLL
jgi:hypothetical protein